jgi:hypothetical protein
MRKGTVLYCDSHGVIDDAKKWVVENKYTQQDVKIVKRGEAVCVLKL